MSGPRETSDEFLKGAKKKKVVQMVARKSWRKKIL